MALEGCDGDGEGPPQEHDDESSNRHPIGVQMSVRRQSLTKRDVLLLLDPTAVFPNSRVENLKKESIDKKSVGWRSSSIVESDDEDSQQQQEENCNDAQEDSEAAHAKKISTEDIHSSCAALDDVVAQTVEELSAQVRIRSTYKRLISSK